MDKAVAVLKDPRLKPAAKTKERREQLRQILFARFDFTEMAKRALAPTGAGARPKNKRNSSGFLPISLERAYADIIESYTDEKIVYLNERIEGAFADVDSKILTSKGEEYSITLQSPSGQPRMESLRCGRREHQPGQQFSLAI